MGSARRLALAIVVVSLAFVAAGCDWPQVGGTAAGTRSTTDPGISVSNVPTLGLSWVGSAGGSLTTPVIASGRAYVGSTNGELYVFDTSAASCSGQAKACSPEWTAQTASSIKTPPAVLNGVAFVGSGSTLYAYDATGTTGCGGSPVTCAPLWTSPLGLNAGSPVVDGTTVYATGGGAVHALDANGSTNCSGSPKVCLPLWSSASTGISAPVAVANGVVYSTGDRLAAFDAAGSTNCSGSPTICSPLWTSDLMHVVMPQPAVADGIVYVRSDRLYAFDAGGSTGCSGAPIVCAPLWETGPIGSLGSSIAVANGLVYTAGAAYDAKGVAGCSGSPVLCSPLWTATGASSMNPAVVNGVLYGASGFTVSAYDATGQTGCLGTPTTCTPLWSATNVGGPGDPVVAFGVVYVGGFGGNLYAYSPWTFEHQECPVNPNPGLSPCQIQDAYRLPAAVAGGGRTIAIVDAYDAPNAETDLATYRSTYGLPPCTSANGCFQKVSQTGTTPSANAGWAVETSLDLDMASATCPLCKIRLVEAADDTVGNLALSENVAASLVPTAISNSYGVGEGSPELSFDHYYTHPGIAMTVATGDNGYGTSWPSTSPNVVSVGGTNLAPDSSTPRDWSETAWSGTGSGCSLYEPIPLWSTNNRGCSRRATADIAAVAGNPGVSVYDTYQQPGWLLIGGTSVSAPIVAAVYGLAPTVGSVGDLNAHPGALFDVTSGSNGSCTTSQLCTAGVGWDGPTGNGTPCGVGSLAVVGFGDADCATAVVPFAGVHASARPKTPTVTYTPACSTPRPGHARCFALKMTLD
jgi:hypothetical protein